MSILLPAVAAGALLGASAPCEAAVAIDGDTVRCADGLRIRMSGIDAPELPGHCRRGRDCAPGDPVRARTDLEIGLSLGVVTYRPIKRDLYGRTVAVVYAGDTNLNCRQLATGNVRYVDRWDSGRHVKRECGL